VKIERINFQETHNQVKYIQDTFDQCGIRIKEHSFLFKLLTNTLKNYGTSNTAFEIFDALHVKRIYSALVTLEDFEGKNKYLKDLMRSTLDFMEASESHSKNILFELEVTGSLRKIFKGTYLDEPDIVVPFIDGNVGIACKKIISEKNFEKQLSNGVKQIKNNNFIFGFIAVNIDNLLPEKTILNANTFTQASDMLHNKNMAFINKYSSKFLRYLSENRIIAVLIVSSTIADIKNERPRFNNISESTLWTIQELEKQHKDKINQFKRLANNVI
jgi:hypothetical protein